MEFFKIYVFIFSFLLLGFIIRGIAEQISILIHLYLYNKRIWNDEKKYKGMTLKEIEEKEIKEILDKYK